MDVSNNTRNSKDANRRQKTTRAGTLAKEGKTATT
jgi:hypothetical protein